MPEDKKPKERKLSEKQMKILNAFKFLASEPTPIGGGWTPSRVGVQCGRVKGSDAADWSYPAIHTLIRKGSVEKVGPGRYRGILEVKPL
jgi:hypothetical protein